MGATVVALLVVGSYGAHAGWHERVADGYHQARAAQDAGSTSAAHNGTDAADDDMAIPPKAEPGSEADDIPLPDRLTRGVGAAHEPADEASTEAPAETPEPPAPEPEADPDDDTPSTATAAAAPEPASEPTPDPAPASAAEPDPEPAPTPPADPEGRMAGLVDDLRRDHGLAPLQRSSTLDEIARAWARVLADEGALRHNPNVGDQVREHYGCCRVAENLMHNSPADVDQAHRQMSESSGHRSNLLDSGHERIGIGIVVDDQNRLWGVQVFHGS